MCIATAALIIGSVATVAGVGIAVSGQHAAAQGALVQGQAQADASRYQAQVARNNAQTAENNAQYVLRSGETDTLNQNLKGRSRLGNVKAEQAASGVDINTGSAVKVRSGEAMAARQDVLTTKSNAEQKAYGYRTTATSEEAQAGLDDRAASAALKGAQITASGAKYAEAGTILGGVSSLANKWGGYTGGAGGNKTDGLGLIEGEG